MAYIYLWRRLTSQRSLLKLLKEFVPQGRVFWLLMNLQALCRRNSNLLASKIMQKTEEDTGRCSCVLKELKSLFLE